MIRTKSVKIWTLLSHAFIIIGMGHGILTLGILEVFSMAALFNKPKATNESDVSSSALKLVGLLAFVGQVLIVISTYVKARITDTALHLIGLFLLWSALLTYSYSIRNDSYSDLVIVTCIPFVYFSIRTVLGRYFQKLWQWIAEIAGSG